MSDSDVAISVRNLHREFESVVAVNRISFNVQRGELFGLVGPDGSGKTTTLRMLAGVMSLTGGDALVDGVSVRDRPEDVKHHTAYMSQRFGMYGDLTVRENIMFYADLYRVPRNVRPERLDQLYGFSNLGPFENRLASQLSGGMRQKLSLCCALIHRPRILLLDEPTFGVDPISRRDLWVIIHQLVAEGVTVLASTAYLDEAERCDRLALLNEGSIVALDAPPALQESLAGRVFAITPDHPRRTRDLLRDAPGVEQATLFGQSVHVVLADAESTLLAVHDMLRSAGIEVRDVSAISPSLEDVFVHIVRPVVLS